MTSRSDDFEWCPDKELFSFMASTFDIAKAKRIIAKKPRDVDSVSIASLAEKQEGAPDPASVVDFVVDMDEGTKP